MNEQQICQWLDRANFIHGYDKNDVGMREWLTPEEVAYVANACKIWMNINKILSMNPDEHPEVTDFITAYQKCLEINEALVVEAE